MPDLQVILYDAQGINPQVPDALLLGYRHGILKCLRQTVPFYGEQTVLEVVSSGRAPCRTPPLLSFRVSDGRYE
jgi:hypothetical protein